MQQFDRAAEDLGNSIHFEHVNVTIPDQRLATPFYVAGLGLTRDPYLMVSDTNMWVNVAGASFICPTAARRCCAVIPALLSRAAPRCWSGWRRWPKVLEGTSFAFTEHNDHVEAICPWGNRVRCYEPDAARFGRITLGIPYVEFDVPAGTAKAICAFYPAIMGMQAEFLNGDAAVARVKAGKDQYLQFRETDRRHPEFDGHHVQIYITDFSGFYHRLHERGLILQEDNQYQYRFRDIIDLDGGRLLFTVEHEVRSATHPMFMRPLVNRNPAGPTAPTLRGTSSGRARWDRMSMIGDNE